MEPALLAVRAGHEPVRPVLLEQLDLVALVEVADLGAAELVGRIQQADDAVADDPPFAARERTDEALAEGESRRRRVVADRVGLARLDQRRPAPAGHEHLIGGRLDGLCRSPVCGRPVAAAPPTAAPPAPISEAGNGSGRHADELGGADGRSRLAAAAASTSSGIGSSSRRRRPNRPNAIAVATAPDVVTSVGARAIGGNVGTAEADGREEAAMRAPRPCPAAATCRHCRGVRRDVGAARPSA